MTQDAPAHHENAPGQITTATAWFARRRSGAMTEPETAAFQAWLGDPGHRSEYDAIARLWHRLEAVRDEPVLLGWRETAVATRRRRLWRRGLQTAGMLAAGLATVQLLLAVLDRGTTTGVREVAFSTAGVGIRSVALEDGSTVQLDRDTTLRVRMETDARRVELDSGRAYFRVHRDVERPFTVTARGRSITALGTSFSVQVAPAELDVILVEGRVRVENHRVSEGRNRIEMSGSSRLRVTDGAQWSVSDVDARRATAWTRGQLIFDDTPLSQVVAELNRYSRRQIRLADDGTAEQRLSAVVNIDQPGTFTQAVAMLGLAVVENHADGSFTLRSSK